MGFEIQQIQDEGSPCLLKVVPTDHIKHEVSAGVEAKPEFVKGTVRETQNQILYEFEGISLYHHLRDTDFSREGYEEVIKLAFEVADLLENAAVDECAVFSTRDVFMNTTDRTLRLFCSASMNPNEPKIWNSYMPPEVAQLLTSQLSDENLGESSMQMQAEKRVIVPKDSEVKNKIEPAKVAVWCFGAIFFELLTDTPLFQAMDGTAIIKDKGKDSHFFALYDVL